MTRRATVDAEELLGKEKVPICVLPLLGESKLQEQEICKCCILRHVRAARRAFLLDPSTIPIDTYLLVLVLELRLLIMLNRQLNTGALFIESSFFVHPQNWVKSAKKWAATKS